MVSKIYNENKKYIAAVAVLAMLVCSFLWFDFETERNTDTGSFTPQVNCCFDNAGEGEVVLSESLSVSLSQTAIAGPVTMRRCGSFSLKMDLGSGFSLSALACSFSFFIILYTGLCNDTHNFIVNYIHNKDGRKS